MFLSGFFTSLSVATCELQWILYLLNDLNVKCIKQPVLYCGSQSAIHKASNPVFHERTKHLEIDCHLVKLLPISTDEQLADFLTKALPPPKFNSFICKLGMINIYHALACGRLLKDNTKKDRNKLAK